MSFSINESQSAFVNPHTCQLTSNLQNTRVEEQDWETVKAGFSKLHPVDERRPLRLPGRTYIDKANNSAQLAAGTVIGLNGGYKLILSADYGFQISGEAGKEQYYDEAVCIRDALNRLVSNADGVITNLYDMMNNYDRWEEYVTKGLKLIGIDASRDFTINGMKYSRNEGGKIESQKMADARLAYKIQTANNRTYEFADEKTKKVVRYRSEYYLSTAPDSVKDAWQEVMGETNINPFVVPYGNTIAQLAMEQDFATGGNDQLFGDTVSDSINAVKSILERIDNPLGSVPEEDEEEYQMVSQREREFYTTLLNKLEKL
ncbi:MAG: hypothetical protein K2K56_06765 [Lachnospiraceae bacterium]|nr:hypothetical protein [Lachnospiraceae bacterium]